MYEERQRGRERSSSEILLHLKSLQNLVLNFFIHLFYQKPCKPAQPPKVPGTVQMLEQPFPRQPVF